MDGAHRQRTDQRKAKSDIIFSAEFLNSLKKVFHRLAKGLFALLFYITLGELEITLIYLDSNRFAI
jgi:hypothetical protein